MGTRAVAAVIQGNRLLIAHVGDSRAYRLRAGQLQQLTVNHSFVKEGLRRGEVTGQENLHASLPRRDHAAPWAQKPKSSPTTWSSTGSREMCCCCVRMA